MQPLGGAAIMRVLPEWNVRVPQSSSIVLLGWREWVSLPDLMAGRLRAKIDTGARSSSLHVERQWRFFEQGVPWIGFVIKPRRKSDVLVEACAPLLDERVVSDSGGHRVRRPFICARLDVAGEQRTIELNLADRRNMLFPLLVGRSALSGFAVDPVRSFLGKTLALHLGQP